MVVKDFCSVELFFFDFGDLPISTGSGLLILSKNDEAFFLGRGGIATMGSHPLDGGE